MSLWASPSPLAAEPTCTRKRVWGSSPLVRSGTLPQREPQVSQAFGNGNRHVLAVQLVYTVSAHLSRSNDSLFYEARQASADPDLRTAWRKG